jgi:hypothetical protein
MQTRGLAGDDSVAGGEMSNLKGLFSVLRTEPAFLNFGA